MNDRADRTVVPAAVHVPDDAIADLRDRLARTRWTDEQPGAGASQGVPLATVRDLARDWASFDWRSAEADLNALTQVATEIDGTGVHAVHERADEEDAPALVLLHGWPSSVLEYTGIVGALREHAHVVVPALPGFPLSGPTPEPGWGVARIADAVAELMTRLGYERFALHGTDTGALVGRELARRHPDRLTVLHTVGATAAQPTDDDVLSDDERGRLDGVGETADSAYAILQSQRPQTLGYGLTDSPVALLAWIGEKFLDWADPSTPVARDTLLGTVSLYWFTATATSSVRVYWEGGRDGSWFSPPEPISVPSAVLVAPHGLAGGRPIRRFVERVAPVVRWTELDRGGHFPALEVPDLVIADLAATLRELRGRGEIGGPAQTAGRERPGTRVTASAGSTPSSR